MLTCSLVVFLPLPLSFNRISLPDLPVTVAPSSQEDETHKSFSFRSRMQRILSPRSLTAQCRAPNSIFSMIAEDYPRYSQRPPSFFVSFLIVRPHLPTCSTRDRHCNSSVMSVAGYSASLGGASALAFSAETQEENRRILRGAASGSGSVIGRAHRGALRARALSRPRPSDAASFGVAPAAPRERKDGPRGATDSVRRPVGRSADHPGDEKAPA